MKDAASSGVPYRWIALIGLPLVAGGIWQKRETGRLRSEHATLLAEAGKQGIDPSANPLPSGKTGRPRPDPLAEARELADALIERAGTGDRYRSDWAAQVPLVDRLQSLNPAQLREMIAIFLEAGDMQPEARFPVLFHLIRRLGDDFPQEALALATGLEQRNPECLEQDGILALFGGLAARHAELDPEAAWSWFLEAKLGWGDWRKNNVLPEVLGGICRVDPALALQKADESGVEELYFVRKSCQTIPQKIAAIQALRTWSRDNPGKRSRMLDHIQSQTLKSPYDELNRFDDVISWIDQADLTNGEIGFFANSTGFDLCYHIDPRETGKWIDWLGKRFPDDEIAGQMKRLFKDKRTGDAARVWRDALPREEAAAFAERYGIE